MEHALAVVDSSDAAKRLVTEAGELAAGVDAELTLLHVTDEEEYAAERKQLAAVTEVGTVYSRGQARDGARRYAADVGREVLDEIDVEYEAIGRLGDRDDVVLQEIEELGIDHVFLAGPKRSPAGKALFGDDTQRIVLQSPVPVTVVTE
jgi:nucleotide-binding universal stress UspA family protein